MSRLQQVQVQAIDPRRFESVLTPPAYADLLGLIDRASEAFNGRVVWNVNSTSKGGGVVELLHPLLGYSRGAGVDARWKVISGPPEFFALTKRIHNHLHGFDGAPGPPGEDERRLYETTLAENASELVGLIRPLDIVILHDPQTAGLIPAVRKTGATVIWRCHVGRDRPNRYAREAWDFLRDYVLQADAYVFSRSAYRWEGLDRNRIAVITPSIDAFSPKNQDQSREQTLAILASAGIIPRHTAGPSTYNRSDGSPGRVDRRAEVLEVAQLTPADRIVTQISRWDRLKDPVGVMTGFVEHVLDDIDAHVVLAGPSTESVADDPEGAVVWSEVREAWTALPDTARAHVHLVSLPMTDVEENAAIVNALQRHSEVVVQKSLAEGFGLTVAEAMWKERPVVGSRIGGIQDQIVDDESGVLISDPRDLEEFGDAVKGLLTDRERARRIGEGARLRVRDHFLAPTHLAKYFALIEQLALRNAETDGKRAGKLRLSHIG